MRRVTVLFAILLASAVHGSEPGQPLDCSDWVMLKAGLTCRPVLANCSLLTQDSVNPVCLSGLKSTVDNEGNVLMMLSEPGEICSPVYGAPRRLVLVSFDRNGTRTDLARLGGRCASASLLDIVEPTGPEVDSGLSRITFDASGGRVLATFWVGCLSADGTCPADYDSDGTLDYGLAKLRLVEISGLSTSFDILQTFSPSAGTAGFSIPAMPDGLRSADRFDTYWGAVTQPLDFANAHPLQCAYPSESPHAGEYMQITAAVPIPTPGSANYILTSVSYQGQTRAGRRASGGRLTGRDASRLPACVEE